MGLDMYLEARRYVSKNDWKDGDSFPVAEFLALEGASGIPDLCKFSEFAGIQVSYPIGYWRKANAIHGWFVQNVQGGTDDCGSYHVEREQLVELRDLCKAAVSQPAMAGDILPPTTGFFFGGYEVDEWYMQDLNYTIEMIDHVLNTVPNDGWNWSIYYHSSW